MHAHYLQHVPFEGLGSIQAWLEEKEYNTTCTRLFESSEFPDPETIDLLIIMGGPMSVNDELQYPWLVSEIWFIRKFLKSGKPVLGICLGAQLIARALGAEVFPNTEKEIGWFPVQAVSTDNSSCFSFPQSTTVFHWHGETFDLPRGAIRLAQSQACKNQAFQFGKSVIGLQFHLETTPESAKALVTNCRNELQPSTYIQSEQEILSPDVSAYDEINQVMREILIYLAHSKKTGD